MNIGNLEVRNTKGLKSPNTRICAMVFCPAKFGKTLFASGLDELTRKYRGKPTLVIACESAEGGGTMTVAEKGLAYIMPQTWADMEQVLAQLATDETYGGVIVDNATDYVNRIVKPHALSFPSKERVLGARIDGVPVRSDYQVMGENARNHFNRLVNLTSDKNPERFRKDLIVTALEREKSDEAGTLQYISPDLPGALQQVAPSIFNTVCSITIRQKILTLPDKTTKRIPQRFLYLAEDGKRISGDRTKMFQHDYPLSNEDGTPRNAVLEMYEQWIQQFKEPS